MSSAIIDLHLRRRGVNDTAYDTHVSRLFERLSLDGVSQRFHADRLLCRTRGATRIGWGSRSAGVASRVSFWRLRYIEYRTVNEREATRLTWSAVNSIEARYRSRKRMECCLKSENRLTRTSRARQLGKRTFPRSINYDVVSLVFLSARMQLTEENCIISVGENVTYARYPCV